LIVPSIPPTTLNPPEEIVTLWVEVIPALFRDVKVPNAVMLVWLGVRMVPVNPLADRPLENTCRPVNDCPMWVLATLPVRLTAPTADTEKSAFGNEATPVTLEVAKGAVYCVMLEATVICLPVWVMVMPDPEVIDTPPVIPLTPLTPLP
jgi:hypothetical protein